MSKGDDIEKFPQEMKDHLTEQLAEQIAFIKDKLQFSQIFEVKHTNDHGMLVELKPAKTLYLIMFIGVHPKGTANYPNAITEKFEGGQPHCCIGSYDAGIDIGKAISLADQGNAIWHVSSPGVPITRVIEEIIKMDYGMRVVGGFLP